jgi:hemolysin activation/secretion protein
MPVQGAKGVAGLAINRKPVWVNLAGVVGLTEAVATTISPALNEEDLAVLREDPQWAKASQLRLVDLEHSGELRVGARVKAHARLLAATEELTKGRLIFEWYVGNNRVLSGMGTSYDIRSADRGHELRVRAIPVMPNGDLGLAKTFLLGRIENGTGGKVAEGRLVTQTYNDAVTFATMVGSTVSANRLVVTHGESRFLAQESIQKVLQDQLGEKVSEQSIRGTLTGINKLYADAKVTEARALVKPQELSAGFFEVFLLEPSIGDIVFTGVDKPGLARALSSKVTGRQGDTLELRSIDMGLGAINERKRNKFRSVVREGKEVGQTDLIVPVTQAAAFEVTLVGNNLGAKETGRNLLTARVGYYGALDGQDSWALSVADAEGLSLKSLSLDWEFPHFDVVLGAGYTEVETQQITGPAAELEAEGKGKTRQLRLSVPVYRAPARLLEFGLSYNDDLNGSAYLGQLIQSDTKTKKTQLSVSGEMASLDLWTGKAKLAGSVAYSAGSHATTEIDDSVTRSRSHRLTLAASLGLELPSGYSVNSKLDFSSLNSSPADQPVTSERFAIGSDKVRGYDQGTALGDRGLALTFEFLGKPVPFALSEGAPPEAVFRPKAFYDWATARTYDLLNPDQTANRGKRFKPFADEIYSSLGVGLQVQLAKGWMKAGVLDAYVATPLDSNVSGRSRDARLGLTLSAIF